LLQAEHDQVGAGSVINVTNQFIELHRGISNASNILTLSDEMRKHSFTEAYQSNNIYFTAVNFPGSSAGPNVYHYVEEMWKEETPTLIGRIKSAVANKLAWIRWHKISPNMRAAIISGVFTLICVLLGKFM
jgi:hypothetical protein